MSNKLFYVFLSLFVFCSVSFGIMPSPVSSEWDSWYQNTLQTRINYSKNFPRSETFYFSDSEGDDIIGNGTIGFPYRSLHKVRDIIQNSNGNVRFLFKRNDIWREKTGVDTGLKPGFSFEDYGDGNKPIFSTFEKFSSWQQYASQNIYFRNESRLVTSVIHQNFPLVEQNTLLNCENMIGSWFYDRVNQKIYVNTLYSISDIEYTTATDAGFILRGDGSYIKNIVALGWGLKETTPSQQHGIEIRTTGIRQAVVDSCEVYFGSSHVIVHLGTDNDFGPDSYGGIGTFVNCIAGWVQYNGSAGETVFNTFSLNGGQDIIFDSCIVPHGAVPSYRWNYGTERRSMGFYGHTGGIQRISRVISYNNQIFNCLNSSSFNDLPIANLPGEAKGIVVKETFDGPNTALVSTGMIRNRCNYVLTPPRNSFSLGNFAQSGFLINSFVTLNLLNQQWDFSILNGLPNSPSSPQIHNNYFRILNSQTTTTFKLDYDTPSQTIGAVFTNNIFVNLSPARIIFNFNTISNNAYFVTSPPLTDPTRLILASPIIDFSCNSILNCRGTGNQYNITSDYDNRNWFRNSIGPIEISSCVDYNRDGAVDFFDYLDFVQDFSNERSDYNNDGAIDFFDYLDFVQDFSNNTCN